MTTSGAAGDWLRTIRAARRVSQRELAELSGVPRTTIDRIEAGRTSPRFDTFVTLLRSCGYELAVCDRRGAGLPRRDHPSGHYDGAQRHFPAHLRAGEVAPYFSLSLNWWGWHHVAWPYDDRSWVPANTFWKRPKLPVLTRAGWDAWPHESGRVWDDAT